MISRADEGIDCDISTCSQGFSTPDVEAWKERIRVIETEQRITVLRLEGDETWGTVEME